MKEQYATSHDGVQLKFACNELNRDKPNIILIMPFGLQLAMAKAFFDTFAGEFNLVVFESRLILAKPELETAEDQFLMSNHVADVETIIAHVGFNRSILVGYCSGAGVALAAINQAPEKYSQLVLVNGEYTLFDDPSCITQNGSDIDSLLPIAALDISKASFILDKIQLDMRGGKEAVPEGINLPFSQAHYFNRYAKNYLCYRATDFKSLAEKILHKTLVVAGQQDQQTNVRSSLKIKQLISDAEMHIDPQADHYDLTRKGSNLLQYLYDYLVKETVYAS